MSVQDMYRDFRKQSPEVTRAADAKHIRIWDKVDDETAFGWFESLAAALNDKMGDQEQHADIMSIFRYFERKLQSRDDDVRRCIDVSFVETLFWQVKPEPAAKVWAMMPKPMQQLDLSFHGRAPTA